MKQYELTPSWQAAIDDWVRTLKAAGRSAATIETRSEHLRRFSRQSKIGSPGLVAEAHIISWAGAHDWSRETRRSTYASLRAFFSWAHESGIIQDNPTAALPSVKPGEPMPRPASEAAYKHALKIADPRARLILRLAGESGLRRAEIAQIQRSDLIQDLDGWTLLVHGKGDKLRLVPLADPLAQEIIVFLGKRQWLFPSPTGGHLTPRHVAKIAKRYLPECVKLHMLRHRFATVANRNTRDLLTIQKLLGHASVATTQRYIAVDCKVLRQTVVSVAV